MSRTVDMKLEVVVIPVSDVDRAKRFYQSLGWREDVDIAGPHGYRAVHLTPPGSSASILIGNKGVTPVEPGSIAGLLLAVHDIHAARAELISQGVNVGEVFHDAGGSLGAAARGLRFRPHRRVHGRLPAVRRLLHGCRPRIRLHFTEADAESTNGVATRKTRRTTGLSAC